MFIHLFLQSLYKDTLLYFISPLFLFSQQHAPSERSGDGTPILKATIWVF